MTNAELVLYGFFLHDMHPDMQVQTVLFIGEAISRDYGRSKLPIMQRPHVLDNDEETRGVPSVYQLWGQGATTSKHADREDQQVDTNGNGSTDVT